MLHCGDNYLTLNNSDEKHAVSLYVDDVVFRRHLPAQHEQDSSEFDDVRGWSDMQSTVDNSCASYIDINGT